jgi:glycine/D-amino acid oxidase-like deaminating enzyme
MNLKAGLPYWLIKDGLPYDYPRLDKNIVTDVIVMGGGISGAITAYYLLKAGINCVVADSRSIGLGSTCASTSLLQYEIDVPLIHLKDKIGLANAVDAYKLCGNSIGKLSDIAKEVSFHDFTFKKSLYYAADKKDVSFLKNEYQIRRENNFRVEFLEKDDIEKQFKFKAPGGILSELAAVTNAYGLTHAIHQYNLEKGGQVYQRTHIKHIHHKKDGVELITDDNISITAKKLIYANGYEAVNYISKKIIDLSSTYATASESGAIRQDGWRDDTIIWNTAKPYLYMRSTPDGRIIVGGRDEKFYNPEKRDKLIESKSLRLKKDFNTIFPRIEFKPEFNWTGVFGSTKDGLPIIGPYKKLAHSYFALGFGGNGITFSVIAAEIITDMILGKYSDDIKLFGFERI